MKGEEENSSSSPAHFSRRMKPGNAESLPGARNPQGAEKDPALKRNTGDCLAITRSIWERSGHSPGQRLYLPAFSAVSAAGGPRCHPAPFQRSRPSSDGSSPDTLRPPALSPWFPIHLSPPELKGLSVIWLTAHHPIVDLKTRAGRDHVVGLTTFSPEAST